MPFVLLGLAIVSEVFATLSLRASEGFSKLVPSVVVVVGYGLSLVLLTQVLKSLSVSVVYAVWSGAGTALIAAVRDSNDDVGGRVVEMSGREYYVRGRGYVQQLGDVEGIAIRAAGPTNRSDLGKQARPGAAA